MNECPLKRGTIFHRNFIFQTWFSGDMLVLGAVSFQSPGQYWNPMICLNFSPDSNSYLAFVLLIREVLGIDDWIFGDLLFISSIVFRFLFAMHFMMCNYRCCKAVLTSGALIINILDKHLRYHDAYYLQREHESMVSNIRKKKTHTVPCRKGDPEQFKLNPNWSHRTDSRRVDLWISVWVFQFSNIPIHKTRWMEIGL